jgi:Pvc16 N-terminal domain
MFEDLDATLRALLLDAGAPPDLRAADVSFDTPDRDFKPTRTTVDLFLHDVAENRELRDNARTVNVTSGGISVGAPPLRIDCTYLVTAWSTRTGGLRAQEEHRLLGLALLWASRFLHVEERFLQGGLKTPPQPYPVPMSVARSKEGQGLGQFWSALGIPPRPTFSINVTITVPPSGTAESFPPAREVRVDLRPLGVPDLTGRVLEHDLAPVPSAWVAVVGTGRHVTAGPTGEFRISGLDLGSHVLLVHVDGRRDVQVPVEFTARVQSHDVVLPPPGP